MNEGNSSGNRSREYNILVVLGPNASGKTRLAVQLARIIGGEIISADSRQVYRGMDLGTGKDRAEYGSGNDAIPVHLIDICEPEEEFSVFAFQKQFYRCLEDIGGRRKVPILAGGTGLYIDSVIHGYKMVEVPENPDLREALACEDMASLRRRYISVRPEVHNTTDLLHRTRLIRGIEIAEYMRDHSNTEQPPVNVVPLVIGIRLDRQELRKKITDRLERRLKLGMIDEVEHLRKSGVEWERIDAFGLEYRYIALYLRGRISEGEMFDTLNTRIHQFAKRQETWFRRMERQGIRIHWIQGGNVTAALSIIDELKNEWIPRDCKISK